MLLPHVPETTTIAVDTETSGLFIDGDPGKAPRARVSVVSASWRDPHTGQIVDQVWPFDQGWLEGKPGRCGWSPRTGRPGFWPLGPMPSWRGDTYFDTGEWNLPINDLPDLLHWLSHHPLVMHHAKFDCHILAAGHRLDASTGFDLSRSVIWDTQHGSGLIWPLSSSSLKPTAKRLWGEEEGDAQLAIQAELKRQGKGLTWRYDLLTWACLRPYAARDSNQTLRLSSISATSATREPSPSTSKTCVGWNWRCSARCSIWSAEASASTKTPAGTSTTSYPSWSTRQPLCSPSSLLLPGRGPTLASLLSRATSRGIFHIRPIRASPRERGSGLPFRDSSRLSANGIEPGRQPQAQTGDCALTTARCGSSPIVQADARVEPSQADCLLSACSSRRSPTCTRFRLASLRSASSFVPRPTTTSGPSTSAKPKCGSPPRLPSARACARCSSRGPTSTARPRPRSLMSCRASRSGMSCAPSPSASPSACCTELVSTPSARRFSSSPASTTVGTRPAN